MPVTPEDVRRVAALAHVGLEPNEIASLASDISSILAYVDRLQKSDVPDAPVATGVLRRRADVAIPTDPEPLLANAPARHDRLVAVDLVGHKDQ